MAVKHTAILRGQNNIEHVTRLNEGHLQLCTRVFDSDFGVGFTGAQSDVHKMESQAPLANELLNQMNDPDTEVRSHAYAILLTMPCGRLLFCGTL